MPWPFGSTWRPMRRTRRPTADLRWLTRRAWTNAWYPQGIDVGTWKGRRTLAVSWFRQDRRRQHLASRISLIDLQRARHLDVALAIVDDDGGLAPARIHTGGIAWFGDRMFAAATRRGVWEFDFSDIRRVRGPLARRLTGAPRWSLRRSTLVAVRTRAHAVDLRCSYLGRVFDAEGTSLSRMLIGEFRPDPGGRIGEFTIPRDADGRFEEHGVFSPGIPRMQGAVRLGEHCLVSQSDGLRPSMLWSGPPGELAPERLRLPVGSQDLALDPEAGLLWSLGEHPRQRMVRALPLAELGIDADGTNPSAI